MYGWLRIGAKLDTSQFDVQVKELENKIQDLDDKAKPLANSMEDTRAAIQTIQKEIDKASDGLLTSEQIIERINGLADEGFDFTYEFGQLKEELGEQEAYIQIVKTLQEMMVANLDTQNTEYKKINRQIDLYKTKLQSIKDTQSHVVHSGVNGFKSLTKGARNLVLGIVGVASAYSFFHKAANQALQSDERLTKQIETNWVGLGTILEPAVRLIVNLFKKATTSVLYFISLLTGVDYIAKANAAALKKQAKATNELTKANEKFTASFDELNIAQENVSSGASIDSGIDESMLFNVKELSETTRETIEKLAKALKPVYEKIKDIIEWGKEHPDIIMKILGGAALLTLLSKIIGVSGVSGLLGISSLLTALALIGVISIGINLYYIGKTYKEVKNEIDDLTGKRKEHLDEVKEENKTIRENAKAYERNSDEIANLNEQIQKGIDKERNYSNSARQTQQSLTGVDKIVAKATGEWDLYSNQIIVSTLNEWEYIKTQKALYEQGKLNSEQTEEYQFRLESFTKRVMGADKEAKYLRDTFLLNGESAEKFNVMLVELNDTLEENSNKGNIATRTINQQNTAINNLAISTSKIPEKKSLKIDTNVDKIKTSVDTMMKTINNATKGTYKIKIVTDVSSYAVNERDKAAKYIMEILGYPMATGGIHIVNNPGKGVLSGGALTGEVSHEGVIPLTDESAMEMLGESIGRHIKIYATLINKMNGKTLSREVQEIIGQSDFASNI